MHELVSGTGQSGPAQDVLHARLVADVERHGFAHPGDAEAIADLTEGDLQLLQDRHQTLDLADLPGQAAHAVGDLLGSSPSCTW